jgi:NADPH:quinone reductase-like Zn-dependent oxidoreductase
METQLAREVGAYVIGAGCAADRQKVLDFGAQEFVDLENDRFAGLPLGQMVRRCDRCSKELL